MPESPYKWTPRERFVRDQNMAHARNCVHNLVANTRNWIAGGLRDEELEEKMVDLVFAEADPAPWPGEKITADATIVAMLMAAVTIAAETRTPR